MAYDHDTKDPNLMNLHKAMVYDADGEPSLRVSIEQMAPGVDLTITGDVIVNEITGVVEISNDVGNPIPISANTETNTITNPLYIQGVTTMATGESNYFGEPYATRIIPVVQLNSYEGVKTRDTQTYTGGGGSVVVDDSDIEVSCTSTPGSYGVYRSRRFIPYRSGQSNVARLLGRFSTPVAGTQQRFGISNQEGGYYIGYNGTDFQFLHNYGGRAEIWSLAVTGTASTNQTITLTLAGVAYNIPVLSGDSANTIAAKISLAVESNAWLPTAVDNTVKLLSGGLGALAGTFSFSSTGNVTGVLTKLITGVAGTDEWHAMPDMPAWVTPTNYTHWQLQYSWSGVNVLVLNHITNRWCVVFRHVLPMGETSLPVKKPAFKVTTVVYNTGGASGVTAYISSMFGGIEGESEITTFTHGGGVTKSSLAGGTFHHIMSIQNPYVNTDNKLNFRMIKFMDLTVATQANDPVEIYIYFDTELVGQVLDFQSYTDRLHQASFTTGAINTAADTPVISTVVGISGSNAQIDLLPYNLTLPPGAHMSLVARSDSTIQKIAVGGIWGTIG